jgi:hypothetical protein
LAVAGGVARPFTDTIHPDVFVVQWAGDQLGQLLRADLKMSQSGLGGVWGVQVLRVAVRELGAGAGGATLQGSILASSADASVVEFDAGNQWLGPAPASEMGAAGEQATGRAAVAVGTQSLRLLPAGLAAFTFNARWVGRGGCQGIVHGEVAKGRSVLDIFLVSGEQSRFEHLLDYHPSNSMLLRAMVMLMRQVEP